MFSAELGSGAQLNGQAIHVSTIGNLGECLIGTGFPSQKRHKNPNIYFYHQLTLRTHGVRRAGSAALDLCNVASGRFDGFWEFNLNPWDTAAGVLMVEEAGGKVTDFSGGPFQIASRETLASNGLVHDALMHEFEEISLGAGWKSCLARSPTQTIDDLERPISKWHLSYRRDAPCRVSADKRYNNSCGFVSS